MHRDNDSAKTPITDATGARWKRLRTLSSVGFTNANLKQVRETVEDTALRVVEHLEKSPESKEIDILRAFQEFTLDIICKVALGKKDVEMFNNQYLDMFVDIFIGPQIRYIQGIPAAVPFLNKPILKTLDFIGSTFNVSIFRLLSDLEKSVAERKKERDAGHESTATDFIDIYLDVEVDSSMTEIEGSRKMLQDEVVAQCMIMLLAGFDTTANSLAYAAHFLANYPDVQEKAREEINRVCKGESVEYDSLSQLEYTHAVIRETLRHYPLASFVVARKCVEATVIKDVRFEVGDQIMTDTWSMHMDKEVWGEDAEEFRPERWLEPSARPRHAFQSFGEGPRMCVGMRLAIMEEKIMLAHLLKNFRICKSANTNPLKLIGDLTVSPTRVRVRLERI